MVDVLTAEVCPSAEDPTLCLEEMPRFWEEIAKIVFPEHWKHICDDLEECQPPTKVCFNSLNFIPELSEPFLDCSAELS